jgi:hypothetical protein
VFAGSFDEFAVFEAGAGADEVRCVLLSVAAN